MSLREEIFKIIADGFMEQDGLIIDYSVEKYTDEILSKFEKRIDSEIQNLDKQLIGSRPSDNEKEYTLKDVIARTSVNLGNIKKEILK